MFCPSNSLLKRVTIAVISSLALIKLLFTAYSAISAALTSKNVYKSSVPGALPETIRETPVEEAIEPVEIDPLVGQKAMEFALKSIADNPNVAPHVFKHPIYSSVGGGFGQPIDARISILTSVLNKVYAPAFNKALGKYKDRCWEESEVLELADACMKIEYAISCLALEDLDKLREEKQAEDPAKTITCEDILTGQRSYVYRAYFNCPSTYHQMKGRSVWLHDEQTSKQFGKLFYKKGTMQNGWNQLHNDYCRKVKAFMEKEKFQNKDPRFLNWIQEDLPDRPFYFPGPQPT